MFSNTDFALRSFVPVAPDSHFPIQNLPYGVFRTADSDKPRCGVRIGDFVVDLRELEHRGAFRAAYGDEHVLCKWSLNKFMSRGPAAWSAVRRVLTDLLRADNPTLRDDAALRAAVLIPIERVTMCLPCEIGDYTDFYSSREHATNVGTMFRGKDNALMPNWLWLPVGYHGRASSIVVDGTDIRRPCGQSKADADERPTFGPSRQLDFELELGFFVGPGNALGDPIALDRAAEHVFGLVLVNDWSARDIQKWEYVPLGPFLGKNFATSISPWVVTLEALAPFALPPPEQDPMPLEYLRPAVAGANAVHAAYDLRLEVALRAGDGPATTIARSNARHLYWTMAQQLAHHTINGCNIRPGDLLASGTISGPTPDSYGSLLELAWRGERPLTLANGERRVFLHDNDQLTLTGWGERDGVRIGFGECAGRVRPARG